MRARVSELAEFSGMWGQHTVVMGGLGVEAALMPGPRAAERPASECTGGDGQAGGAEGHEARRAEGDEARRAEGDEASGNQGGCIG